MPHSVHACHQSGSFCSANGQCQLPPQLRVQRLVWKPVKYAGFLTLTLCAGVMGGAWNLPYLTLGLCLPQAGLLGWHYGRKGAVAAGLLMYCAWLVPGYLNWAVAAQVDTVAPVIAALLSFLFAWTNALSRANIDYAHYHAETDSLTKLLNRHGFEQRLQSEAHRGSRRFSPLTVVFMDCDHFKRLNDTHGHHTGDRLLIAAGSVMQSSIRDFDFAARLGGDEFTLLLPSTDLSDARIVLDRLQYRLDALAAVNQWDVTWSIGAVTFLSPASSQKMLQVADELMYEVKHTGKGRIAIREWKATSASTPTETSVASTRF